MRKCYAHISEFPLIFPIYFYITRFDKIAVAVIDSEMYYRNWDTQIGSAWGMFQN